MLIVPRKSTLADYHIWPKYWDTLSTYCTCPKIWNSQIYHLLMCLKYYCIYGKQYRPWSDAAFCSILSGATLLAKTYLPQSLGLLRLLLLRSTVYESLLTVGYSWEKLENFFLCCCNCFSRQGRRRDLSPVAALVLSSSASTMLTLCA